MEPDAVLQDDNASIEKTTPAPGSGTPVPNRRQYNPLAEYSSFNYQLVLAILTPEAYNIFVKSGRRALPQIGSYLVAQSGGINKSVNDRADGFKFDYYIDDLKMVAAISPSATGAAMATHSVSFNIIEPYGFSFPTNLKRASIAIGKLSKLTGTEEITNASKQLFVLGIRFLGYDKNGEVVSKSERIFDRYYDITISEMKFRIDGRTSTYAFKAAAGSPGIAGTIKRGMINKEASIIAANVGDALTQLAVKLTRDQIPIVPVENQDRNDRRAAAANPINTYAIEFRGPGSDLIKTATLANKADTDKSKAPMGVTVAEVPNTTKRAVVFKNDTPILQGIQQVISQSSFVTDALKIVTQAGEESSDPNIVNANKKSINWYNVTMITEPKAWNTSLNDWEFNITYVIQPYKTPFTLSTNANKTTPYYGPAKKYNYWYTGQNSEVLKFEQTLNVAFFTVALAEDQAKESKSKHTMTTFKKQSGDHLGVANDGPESALEYVTSLLDPGAWATCKIDIMGDPDWLTYQGAPPIENDDFSPFYGPDGFSINPTSSQVFIEINFNEAVDYDSVDGDGLLGINDKILFWDYSPEIARVLKGISYNIIECTSTFSRGQFKQTLTGPLNSTFTPNPGLVPPGPPDQRKPDAVKQAPRPGPPPTPEAFSQIVDIQQNNDDAAIGQGRSPFQGA